MDESKRNKYKSGRKPVDDPAIYRYGIKLNSLDNAKKEIKVVKIDPAAMAFYMCLTTILYAI